MATHPGALAVRLLGRAGTPVGSRGRTRMAEEAHLHDHGAHRRWPCPCTSVVTPRTTRRIFAGGDSPGPQGIPRVRVLLVFTEVAPVPVTCTGAGVGSLL